MKRVIIILLVCSSLLASANKEKRQKRNAEWCIWRVENEIVGRWTIVAANYFTIPYRDSIPFDVIDQCWGKTITFNTDYTFLEIDSATHNQYRGIWSSTAVPKYYTPFSNDSSRPYWVINIRLVYTTDVKKKDKILKNVSCWSNLAHWYEAANYNDDSYFYTFRKSRKH